MKKYNYTFDLHDLELYEGVFFPRLNCLRYRGYFHLKLQNEIFLSHLQLGFNDVV